MSEVPDGWATATIGSLCRLENGRAFKPSDWTNSGLPIVRIQNLNNARATFNYFNSEIDSRYYLRGGELLFAWSGTPGTSFGAHIWRGGEAVLNQHIFRVDFDSRTLDKRFFRHAINQKLNELIDVAHGGVGLRHVTKGVFESTKISVPPFYEQKRIADKLDVLFARVDACRENMDRFPALIKRFRQAVLDAATSGELTAEWRAIQNASLPAHVILSDYVIETNYGTSAKSTTSGIIPVLRMGNIQDGHIDWSDLVYTSDPVEIKKYALKSGDVLFNRTNSPDLVGKTAIFNGEREAIFAGYLVRFRCGQKLLPDYINYCLNSPEGRDYCWRVKSDGVSQSNINAKKLLEFRFLLPQLTEQQEIIRRVNILFAFADRLVTRVQAAQKAVERVTPVLLSKAFRGELILQDPSDEPASTLLERIRVARLEAPVITHHARRKTMQSQILKNVKSARELVEFLAENPIPRKPSWIMQAAELEVDDFYAFLREAVAQGWIERPEAGPAESELKVNINAFRQTADQRI